MTSLNISLKNIVYRIELQKRLPWLAISEKEEKVNDTASTVTTEASMQPTQQATA